MTGWGYGYTWGPSLYFGKLKLNKILFYADFLFYKKTGETITSQDYMRLEKGPVPRRMVPVMEGMSGRLAFKKERLFDRFQERPIALDEPDLAGFRGDQIAMVNEVIEDSRARSSSANTAARHHGALTPPEAVK